MPNDNTPEPQDVIEGAYPAPQAPLADGNPLIINGTEIEGVVLLPKGHISQNPALSAYETENAVLRKKVSELSAKNEELVSSLKTEKATREELSAKFEEIETKKKATVIEEMASLRIDKGFLKEEDKDSFIKKLSSLTSEQLEVQLEDIRSLSANPQDTPEPPVTPEDGDNGLDEKDIRKNALRKELFGRENKPEAE